MTSMTLGQATEYPQEYAPAVLCPIARAEARSRLGLGSDLPFHGVDIWNAWELTWLDAGGKPKIATATFTVGADSPNLIESKSLKLYLGAFAMSHVDSASRLEEVIARDLSRVAGAAVTVRLMTEIDSPQAAFGALPGRCVDALPFASMRADVDPNLLRCASDTLVAEALHSHLLRSLCPVTGQPDHGSVLIRYEGPQIDPAAFLEYVVSFRRHNDFHEACVERMFLDISGRCRPRKLTVYARYNRRGGIDINPFRSNFEDEPTNLRLWRQ